MHDVKEQGGNMKVIEQFLKGKFDKDELCEDGICVTKDFVAVIDGVSSQSEYKYQNKKLGKIICDILLEAIPKLDNRLDCYQTIDFLNAYIFNYYKEYGILEKISDDVANQPSASVIMYSKYYNQIWLIGDCMALYGDTIIENKLEVDELYTKIRTMTIEYLLATGYTEEQLLENDIAKKFVQNLSKRQPYIRNKIYNSKYDYAVIDGFNKPNKKLIKCIDLPNNIKEIVFVSDGYRKPFYTLRESEEYLKHIKEVDPLCYKEYAYERGFYNNQVNYDDRAYIKFEII